MVRAVCKAALEAKRAQWQRATAMALGQAGAIARAGDVWKE